MKKANNHTLHFIIPNDAQRKQWDALVLASANGNVYSLSWYLDVVSDNSWGLITDSKITTGLPVAFKKRTGYKNVYQPFYTMFFDVIDPVANIDEYLACIQHDFHHILITTQSKNNYLYGKQGNLKTKLRVRQEMKLKAGFEKNYSENATRQIKKALKSELKFAIHPNGKEVVDVFKKNKGAELKEYKTTDFKRLEVLIEACLKHKHGFCANVTQGKTVLASGFFITYNNNIIFLKGGVTEEGKKIGAMYYLMHKIFEVFHVSCNIFDFGGSNNKNVGDFYRKLGGKDIEYDLIEIDNRNIVQKVIGKIRK